MAMDQSIKRKVPTKLSEITKEYYDNLVYFRDAPVPKDLHIIYANKAVNYMVPKEVLENLEAAKLIKQKYVEGFYVITELGTSVLEQFDNYVSFYSMKRGDAKVSSDLTFEQIKYAKRE